MLLPFLFDLCLTASPASLCVGFHAFVVEIFIFGDVADIELNSPDMTLIIDFKIIPIGMTSGVGVAADEAIVL